MQLSVPLVAEAHWGKKLAGGKGMNGKVMPVRIVPMKTEHLDAVAELERSCFTVPWSRNALAEELDNALSAFLVALDENDRVVGYAGLQVVLDEGYITNVAVRPDCRRRGVAGSCSMSSSALPRQSPRVSLARGAREQLRRYRALRTARLPRRGTPQELL